MEEIDILRQIDTDACLSRDQLVEKLVADILDDTPSAALRRVAAKRRLATEFGAGHGWALAKKRFGLIALKRGTTYSLIRSDADALADQLPHDFFDHPYFYRTGGKAVAIAAHLYGFDPQALAAFATENGLSWETPDFPSWWYPGATRIVVFTKADKVATVGTVATFP